MRMSIRLLSVPITALLSISALLTACAGPVHGPDKVFEGEVTGAVTGAGAGAVTGFQVGAGTGPGAAVGAGFGAAIGAVQGLARDKQEDSMMALAAGTQHERELAVVHEILQDHYKRRMELHPTRDIYPADLFFLGDRAELCPTGKNIIKEISRMNQLRYPWSRLVIVTYAKSISQESEFAQHIVEERSRAIGDEFVKAGMEPRRIETKAMIVPAPVLIDPADNPGRYNQAIEIIPVDR